MATSGFNIKLDTGREGIEEKLAAFKASPDIVVKKAVLDAAGKVVTPAETKQADQSLIEEVKTFIKDQVAGLAPEFDGVLIIASGQADAMAGRATATIQIYGKKGHL